VLVRVRPGAPPNLNERAELHGPCSHGTSLGLKMETPASPAGVLNSRSPVSPTMRTRVQAFSLDEARLESAEQNSADEQKSGAGCEHIQLQGYVHVRPQGSLH
jgi:hypothetical protein